MAPGKRSTDSPGSGAASDEPSKVPLNRLTVSHPVENPSASGHVQRISEHRHSHCAALWTLSGTECRSEAVTPATGTQHWAGNWMARVSPNWAGDISRLLQMGKALPRPSLPTLDVPVALGRAHRRPSNGDCLCTYVALPGKQGGAVGLPQRQLPEGMGESQQRAASAQRSPVAACVHSENGASGSWRHWPWEKPCPVFRRSQNCVLGNGRESGSLSQQVTQSRKARGKGKGHRGFPRVIGRFVSFGPSRGRGWYSLQHTPKGRAVRSRAARQRQEWDRRELRLP